jgi:transcription elongation factor Elf1
MEIYERSVFDALIKENPSCKNCGKEIRSQKILKIKGKEYHMTCGMIALKKAQYFASVDAK